MNSDNDIVTRLRQRHCSHGNNYNGAYQPIEWSSTCERCELDKEAAEEIERLRVLVDSVGKALEGMSCHNCDDRKCMDCVFRSQHDKCYDDCHVCTPQDRVRDPFTGRYVERERVLKLWELDKEVRRG